MSFNYKKRKRHKIMNRISFSPISFRRSQTFVSFAPFVVKTQLPNFSFSQSTHNRLFS